MNNEFTFKFVLIGAMNCGKSSIAQKYIKNTFSNYLGTTIGAAFMTKTYQKSYGVAKIELWDTAGQERFESLMPLYYRNSDVVFVVYDITSTESFKRAQQWVKTLKKTSNEKGKHAHIILVGNKCDMYNKREIDEDVARQYATNNELVLYETSAKTGHNIATMFDDACEQAYVYHTKYITAQKNIILNNESSDNFWNCSGCLRRKNM